MKQKALIMAAGNGIFTTPVCKTKEEACKAMLETYDDYYINEEFSPNRELIKVNNIEETRYWTCGTCGTRTVGDDNECYTCGHFFSSNGRRSFVVWFKI